MRRPLAFVLVAGSTLIASACGAHEVSSDDASAPGTARMEIVSRTSFGTKLHESRATGVVDYERDRSAVVFEWPGVEDQPAGTHRTIEIGGVSYSELQAEPAAPPGKRWIRSDDAEVEQWFEESAEPQESEDGWTSYGHIVFLTADVTPRYRDYLLEVAEEPEQVGSEDVRGVPTTRYGFRLDERRAMRHDLEQAGWKPQNVNRAVETVVGTAEVDVWVDAEGLVRRVVRTESVPQPLLADSESILYMTTTEFFDFGVAVDIQPPPEHEVLEWADWARQMSLRFKEEAGINPLPGSFEPEP